jgi:hypothetical protein
MSKPIKDITSGLKERYEASKPDTKGQLKASREERELNATRIQIRTCINVLITEDDKISMRLEAMHKEREGGARGGA